MKIQKQPLSSEAVSAASAKAYLRIPDDVPAYELDMMIDAAVDYCENVTGREFAPRAYRVTGTAEEMLTLPGFSPAAEISEITRTDPDGTEELDPDDIVKTETGIDVEDGDYTVEYTAEAPEIPPTVTQAILLLIGHWYDNRTSVAIGTTSAKVEMTTDLLLRAHKGWWF